MVIDGSDIENQAWVLSLIIARSLNPRLLVSLDVNAKVVAYTEGNIRNLLAAMKGAVINPGELLQGRYQVIRHLAEGGFSHTFEVKDGGKRKVLKVLNLDNFYNREYRETAISLFKREADVLSKLNHRGIPRVEPDGYFTFSAPGLEPFHCLVMEYIEGVNLAEWLKNHQPISSELAIDWLKQLAKILEAVHQQEFFHRDIKPSNIMLNPYGQLVLIDFGGVRQITDTYLAQIGVQRQGTQICSRGYTPPEQSDGEGVPQSDFFALGRTFVHLLTGKHPLEFPKNRETLQLIWRDSAPQVKPPLADLVDYFMAPFPGQRPQNTNIILQCVEAVEFAVINGLSAVSQNPSASKNELPKPSRWEGSFKLQFKSAALLLAGIIAFVVLPPPIASSFNRIGYKQYLDKQFSIAEFSFRLALIFNPNLTVAHYNLGAACEQNKNYNCSRNEYQIAIHKGDDDTRCRAINNLSYLYIFVDKKYDSAVKLLWQGLRRAEDVAVKSDLHKNLGWAYLRQNRYAEAEAQLRGSIALKNANTPAQCLLSELRKIKGDEKAVVTWEKCSN